jgi:formate dehydrogenase subunit delta
MLLSEGAEERTAEQMTSGKLAKLVRMANQIGDFYAAMPADEATAGAARAYWTPNMIRELVAFADAGGAGLNPTAARAIEAIRRAAA